MLRSTSLIFRPVGMGWRRLTMKGAGVFVEVEHMSVSRSLSVRWLYGVYPRTDRAA
jgi:hypothetical protein